MKSKLAIFSFVLSIIIALPIILFYFLPIAERMPGFLGKVITAFLFYSFLIIVLLINYGILLALSALAVVIAIVGLKRIKKYGLGGKRYALASLIVASLAFLYYSYMLLMGGISLGYYLPIL